MADLVMLTKEAYDVLMELVHERRNRRQNTANRLGPELKHWESPDVLLALPPSGGIPPMSESGTGTGTGVDDPGSAECKVFRRQGNELVDQGFTRTVYNYGRGVVPDNQYVLTQRDKFGDWYVSDGTGTPTVYLALTPPAGVPALSEASSQTGTGTGVDDPGVAWCRVYRMTNSSGVNELQDQKFSEPVVNLSRTAVPGNTYVPIVRDKWGTWVVAGGQGTAGGSSSSSCYIILTPASGIPAATSGGSGTTGTGVDDAGFVNGPVNTYKLVQVGSDFELTPSGTITSAVWNVSPNAVPGNQYCAVQQDGFGNWLVVPSQPPPSPPYYVQRVYTASATRTKPTSTIRDTLSFVEVELVGGGGGGGGCVAFGSAGGGGAGGTYARAKILASSLGSTAAVTVGAGGSAGGSGTNGGAGGSSSFGTLLSASGGNGGQAGVSTSGPVAQGFPNVSTTGAQVSVPGQCGGVGSYIGNGSPGSAVAGNGGGSMLGSGGGGACVPFGGFSSAVGGDGQGHGAGGGGGAVANGITPGVAGGAGSSGLVVVREYYNFAQI